MRLDREPASATGPASPSIRRYVSNRNRIAGRAAYLPVSRLQRYEGSRAEIRREFFAVYGQDQDRVLAKVQREARVKLALVKIRSDEMREMQQRLDAPVGSAEFWKASLEAAKRLLGRERELAATAGAPTSCDALLPPDWDQLQRAFAELGQEVLTTVYLAESEKTASRAGVRAAAMPPETSDGSRPAGETIYRRFDLPRKSPMPRHPSYVPYRKEFAAAFETVESRIEAAREHRTLRMPKSAKDWFFTFVTCGTCILAKGAREKTKLDLELQDAIAELGRQVYVKYARVFPDMDLMQQIRQLCDTQEQCCAAIRMAQQVAAERVAQLERENQEIKDRWKRCEQDIEQRIAAASDACRSGQYDLAREHVTDLLGTVPKSRLAPALVLSSQIAHATGNTADAARAIQEAVCFGASAPPGMDSDFNELWAKAAAWLPPMEDREPEDDRSAWDEVGEPALLDLLRLILSNRSDEAIASCQKKVGLDERDARSIVQEIENLAIASCHGQTEANGNLRWSTSERGETAGVLDVLGR